MSEEEIYKDIFAKQIGRAFCFIPDGSDQDR
jgi:hypothetical protein